MTNEPALFKRAFALGVLLTLTVMALQYANSLESLERWFYDQRARHFQYFTPKPTDRLVHVDIDDIALQSIGRWPWPRQKLAPIVNELRIAGTKVVGFDVIFSEAQDTTYEPQPDGTVKAVDGDDVFASALKRLNRVVLPVSLDANENTQISSSYLRRLKILTQDLLLDQDQVDKAMNAAPPTTPDAGRQAEVEFVDARRAAIHDRVRYEVAKDNADLQALRQRLFPKMNAIINDAPQLRIMHEEYDKVRAERVTAALSVSMPPGAPQLLTAQSQTATIPAYAQVCSAIGFVDYLTATDGAVRGVPLWMAYRGRMFPQIGLALAAQQLDLDLQKSRIENDRVILVGKDGAELAIPARMVATPHHGSIGAYFDIPWFGADRWEYMYDYPNHRVAAQHLPIGLLWDTARKSQTLIDNDRNIDKALKVLLWNEQPGFGLLMDEWSAYAAHLPPLYDFSARRKIIADTFHEAEAPDQYVQTLGAIRDDDPDPVMRATRHDFFTAYNSLKALASENERFMAEITEGRRALHDSLHGATALIGWTATGRMDKVPTSLHATAPGVVTHGVVFNAIVTGFYWRVLPSWILYTVTLFMGLAVTLLASRLSPWKALIAMLGVFLLYIAINGLVLFDKNHLILGVAAPFSAALLSWTGITLVRLIVEAIERARITRRFRSYVDPKLVDYCIKYRDKVRFDGERRELTVCFTDLAGFTTISEKLQEKTVPLLNEYFSLMIPLVRKHDGLVNKLLGDGIMFFYGAPENDPAHARQAVLTALEMQDAMIPFNKSLATRGLPHIGMRCGVVSGQMIVGDAGPADNTYTDYTALGDDVNLSSRLEGANKVTGTKILVTDRTIELIGDQFLFRPVAKLQVKGKTRGVMTYEPLCAAAGATADLQLIADHTRRLVDHYIKGDFRECLAAIEVAEKALKPESIAKLAHLYRHTCEEHLATATPNGFDGSIALTEK